MKSNFSILLLTLSVLGLFAGCGTSVKSIDLHDPNVPLEARRYVADAQDTVSIARARRDDAQLDLQFTEDWREEVTDNAMWPKGSSKILGKLDSFTSARVDMAELKLERAEAKLDLAKAKYTLATAETAMRNDLAVYDLKPLRADTNKIRNEIEEISGKVEDQRIKLDKLTLGWWKAYSKFSGSGKVSRAFYVSSKLAEELREREKQKKAQRDKSKSDKESKKEKAEAAKKKKTKAKVKTERPKEDSEAITEEDKIDLDL